MEGLIRLDTDGLAQLTRQLVSLTQGDICDTSHRGGRHHLITILKGCLHLIIAPAGTHILPGGTEVIVQGNFQQLMVGKEHHVASLGDSRQVQLLRIAVHTHLDTSGIHPATSVIAWTQVLEVADDVVAQIVLQMLGTAWIARLRTSPDAIKELRTILQVKAKSLKMIIPVGVLDDDFHLGVHCLCRTNHQVLRRIVHQLQAIGGPCPITFGSHLYRTLTTGEEKVVEQELIEMTGSGLSDLLHHLAMLRVRVAEGLKLVALIDGKGDATCHLETLFQEELLGFLNRFIIYNQQIAMRLQVDLIDIQLAGDDCPR